MHPGWPRYFNGSSYLIRNGDRACQTFWITHGSRARLLQLDLHRSEMGPLNSDRSYLILFHDNYCRYCPLYISCSSRSNKIASVNGSVVTDLERNTQLHLTSG